MAKVKGTNVVNAVKLLRKNREAARASLPPSLHHYLEERILETSWYPEEDLVALLRVIARLLRDVAADPFELMGRAAVRDHSDGVYGHLLRGGRRSMGRRVGALWQTQHDTGQLTMLEPGPGCARWELTGYGHPSREMCGTIRGYVLEALTLIGLADVGVSKSACVLDGADRCAWDSRWTEPPEEPPDR